MNHRRTPSSRPLAPGETYHAYKQRIDDAGRATIAMINDHALDVFEITGCVDNRFAVIVVDTVDDPVYGPSVTVLDEDGCLVQIHAIRVGLTTDLPIGHPARSAA